MVYHQFFLCASKAASPVLRRSDVGEQFQPWNAAKLQIVSGKFEMRNVNSVPPGMKDDL